MLLRRFRPTVLVLALALIGATAGVRQPTMAAEEAVAADPDEELSAALNRGGGLDQLLAEILSRRLDVVDVSYVSPSDPALDGGWRADYNWRHSRRGGEGFTVKNGVATVRNVTLSAAIDGSYAFGESANTENYSRALVDFGLERGGFGRIVVNEGGEGYQRCLKELDIRSADYPEKSRECQREYSVGRYVPDGRKSYFWVAALHFSLEGDQDFSVKNNVFGASALVRPRGNWPSLGVALERVDPRENEARVAIAGAEDYLRWSIRLSYKTSLERVVGSPVWLFLGYQRFEELSPPSPVQEAELHRFDFLSISLRIPASTWFETSSGDTTMLFLRYTEGELPFDVSRKTAFEIGVSYDLGKLGSLLSK